MLFSEWKELHDYCMAKPCAYETRPFGETPLCYRVAGKIFAQLTPNESWFKMTLKTTPEAAETYRMIYPGIVVRGYHCPPVQQPYWNTIELAQMDKSIVLTMIDEAYDTLIQKLPKKDRLSLSLIQEFSFQKTNSDDPIFLSLCKELDATLSNSIGTEKQKGTYDKHNQLDFIQDVFLVYHDGEPVGCGAYKLYDDETVEIKRIYLKPICRGKGVAKELLRRIEADARIAGFRYAVLETNRILTSATGLYHKMGYKIIDNYPPYTDLIESVCMKKKL